MVSRVSLIIFFLAFGINSFIAFAYAPVILGLSALVAGIAMVANA